jgi:hypothetical protein
MGALSFVSAAGSLPVALSIRPNIFSLDAQITSASDRIVFHALGAVFFG